MHKHEVFPFHNKTLSVIAPIVLTNLPDGYATNDRYGRLIETFASAFHKVIVPVALADESQKAFYPEDEPLYTYRISSDNIEVRILKLSTANMSPVEKLIVWVQRILPIFRSIWHSEFQYIVMPGFTPTLAVVISKILRRQYMLYFGSDWDTISPYMARWRNNSRLLNAYRYVSRKAERYSVRGSLFTMTTGKMLRERLEKHGDNVFETVPMIPLRKEDFFVRSDTCTAKPIRLLFIGTLTESKGVLDLIESIPLIREEGIDVECTLIGGGEPDFLESLLTIAKQKGIESYIQFMGYVAEYDTILAAYREADIFILPTLSEGFPRVLYEAMSQGLPVVTTNIPSIKAMLEDSKEACLVGPGRPTEIASSVVRIVKSPRLRRSLIEQGYIFVRGRVAGETTGEQVLRLLKDLTKGDQKEQDLALWSRQYYQHSQPYMDRMVKKWSRPWKSVFEDYREVVVSNTPHHGRILDFGCGGGQSSYYLSEEFDSVVGVDLSLGMLREFPGDKKKGNLAFVNADASLLPFCSGCFDSVASFATIEHLSDIEGALLELDRLLAPKGRMILMGPNMLSPFHSLKLFFRGLVSGRKHPDGRLSAVLHRSWSLIRKSFSASYQFDYREPYIDGFEFLGSDYDAICLVNPIDLKRWAESHGYAVLSLSRGSSFGGRIISRIFPNMAGGLCFIATKGS